MPAVPLSHRWPARLLLGALAALVFAVQAPSEIRSGADSRWTVFVAWSLLSDRDPYLDEFLPHLARQQFLSVDRIDDHLVSSYPIAISVLALPFVALLDPLVGTLLPLPARLLAERGDPLLVKAWTIESLIASAWVALATVFVTLAACQRTTFPLALLTGLTFAFGTTAWSTASRGLWGHAPALLALAVAVWLVLQAPARPALLGWVGLPLGLAFAVRPQTWPIALALSGYVALSYRRQLPWLLGMLVLPVLPVLAYHCWLYGRPFSPYSSPGQLLTASDPLLALAGLLVSPSRGLVIYSPILLVALVGAAARWRAGQFGRLEAALALSAGLTLLMLASFANWWGGHSFGPRLLTDLLPLLMVFLADGFEAIRRGGGGWRLLAGTAIAGLLLISVAIHAIGANTYAVNLWNSQPVNVDQDPARLWSLRDAQLLRYRPWIP
jgi:hypothetical protein